ncbi:MAG: ester cyclase [Amaricoccus sp.]
MTAADHEALVRAYIGEVFDGHRLDGLERYWHDDLVSHWMGMETIHGLPDWREGMRGFFAAFPDAAYALDDIFFAGDRGVWRGRWQATQSGPWQGVAPTGRKLGWSVVIVARFEGGRMAEDWVELDRLGLFQQLGCIPTG